MRGFSYLSHMQPIYKIFVKIDKRFQDEIETESGIRFYKDTTYKLEENSTVVGEVVAVPAKIDPHSATPGSPFFANVEVGDKLYFHFNVTIDEENRIEVDGEELWMVDYFHAIAIVRDNKIYPVGSYVLVEPIEEKIETSLIVPDTVEKEKCRGKVVASNVDYVPEGAVVEYEEIGKFWNIIESKRLYCMFYDNIILIYE